MGSSSSKLRKHLQHGNEYAALELYNNNADLRKGLDPNLSYGDNHSHDTPLHLAAKHGMKALLRIFLFRHGGNPNKKNAANETSLHNLCQTSSGRNIMVQQRRTECLMLMLQWTGATLEDGTVEKVDMAATDQKDNTALHYAAASGLKRCVELLVTHNAPLFTENAQKQTPCDCAEKNGHSDIALYLESKMVFSGEDEEPDNLEMETILDQLDSEEAYSGLRAQDLQEAKDQLLVETSDMLRVPLFTAEALLRNHEWSRETLLESWIEDPIACCDKCGVVPPASVCDDAILMTSQIQARAALDPREGLEIELNTPLPELNPPAEVICDICACLIVEQDGAVSMTCDHQFCRACWQRYLTGKINEGEAHNITCPGFGCSKLVPVDVIETLVPRDIARRYLQFDIKAFVDSNPSIKWCPYPGCGRAVRLPESDNPLSPQFRGMRDPNITNDFSHAVDCGAGHIFCWECLGEAHEPASCDNWKRWYQKIAEIRPEQLSGTEEETEIAANCLWLVTNSKTCPNCKSPIQKNEGCNHMKCSKCKHDFCWVCLEPWKRHSSTTGGYFRCNRYEVVKKVHEGQENLKADAEEKNKKLQELNRFVHYYTRFKNHENSFKLEEPLLTTAKEKMMVLARAVTDQDTANTETQFVKDAVHHLLKARRVLRCSYAYGFYLGETGYKKPIFEFMQTELEECTETLSEMIARPYLRTPRSKIIAAAALVHRKRSEFLTAISKGLVPTDTSPSSRRKKGRYTRELDEDLKKMLLDCIPNPDKPWVKDASTGKHANVAALLDWPEEEESEEEEDPMETTDLPGAEGVQSICQRKGCRKRRAKNPRTGEEHKHCSIMCMQSDAGDEEDKPPREEVFADFSMDLRRAIEMSLIQFQREMGQLRPGTSSSDRSPVSPNPFTEVASSISGLILQDADLPPPPSPPPATSTTTTTTSKRRVSDLNKDKHNKGGVLLASGVQEEERREGMLVTSTGDGVGVKSDLPSTAELGVSPIRRGRVQSEPGNTSMRTHDDRELQRALELSRASLHEEERDLKMAIELSLKESTAVNQDQAPPSSVAAHQKEPHPHHSSKYRSNKKQSRSDEKIPQVALPEYSSIVMRVPNRSVEDLAQGEGPMEVGGACGGLGVSRSAAKAVNPFGLIKDISVTNINIGTEDKTKGFEDKRFAFKPGPQHYSSESHKRQQPRSDNNEATDEIHVDETYQKKPESLKNPLLLTKRNNTEINKPHNVDAKSKKSDGGGKSPNKGKSFTVDPSLNNAAAASGSKPKGQGHQGQVLDPDDLHIDAHLLESMIQGADGYQKNNLRISASDSDEEIIIRRPNIARQTDAPTDQGTEQIMLLERTPAEIDKDEESEENAVFV